MNGRRAKAERRAIAKERARWDDPRLLAVHQALRSPMFRLLVPTTIGPQAIRAAEEYMRERGLDLDGIELTVCEGQNHTLLWNVRPATKCH